jgi:cytochrome b
MKTQTELGGKKIRVWDLPTRVFHWSIVVLFIFSWVSAEIGGTAMQYHLWSGYAILSLVIFRVLWGVVGSETTRFAHFVRGPRTVMAHARAFLKSGYQSVALGHNALGGWSVLAMLFALALQTTTGLFANDDLTTEGPLYHLVSKATSDLISEIHSSAFYVLLALVVIHIVAIGFYRVVHRQNLLTPMLTGDKVVPQGTPALRQASVWLALVLALAAGGAVYWIVTKL